MARHISQNGRWRTPPASALGVICEPFIVVRYAEHRSLRDGVGQTFRNIARLFRSFAPMLGVIKEQMGVRHFTCLK